MNKNPCTPTFDPEKFNLDQLCSQMTDYLQQQTALQLEMLQAGMESGQAALAYNEGLANYLKAFAEPQQIAVESFFRLQQEKAKLLPSYEDFRDHAELLKFNLELAGKGLQSTLTSMADFHWRKLTEAWVAMVKTIINGDQSGEELFKFIRQQATLLDKVVHQYPQAIKAIKEEYGFHFDREGYRKAAETDRFFLYQVLPSDPKVKVREDGKPVLLIPPYVLGENILCFLPGERKSYAHAYANQGVPTYIRVVKDIRTTPAVQDMNGEDDVRDTRYFCEKLRERHGRPATLNGYCQGGFFATLAVLSGELDGLVDTLITCVAPLDGTRSRDLARFMANIPANFTDLGYAVQPLPNGKPVVSGKVMSWVYKLKSIESEAPLVVFYRDLAMFDQLLEKGREASKTACAINYWLLYDQVDMPVEVTKLSFASYNTPVDKEGTLPIKLFGRRLNFKRLEEKGINFLICYAAADDLVDRDAAVAACDYVKAEVTEFPKGHAAIATSWSHPESACALHTVFGNNYRGPVRYHLDIEAGQRQAEPAAIEVKTPAAKSKASGQTAAKTGSKAAKAGGRKAAAAPAKTKARTKKEASDKKTAPQAAAVKKEAAPAKAAPAAVKSPVGEKKTASETAKTASSKTAAAGGTTTPATAKTAAGSQQAPKPAGSGQAAGGKTPAGGKK
ncbi:MAG: metal transporter [Deltaproteobacteria bacterium]|nr:metal transporter [Deltaproteobacteria bacterium]